MKVGWVRGASGSLVGVLVVLSVLVPIAVRRVVPWRLNPVIPRSLPEPSLAVRRLHASLTLVDLHSDALLWGTNLLKRHEYGHVDLPRLVAGRVAIQAFSVVTNAPVGINVDSNATDWDLITWLAVAQGWPPRTWLSAAERALYQAGRLERAARASDGRLVVVRDRRTLEDVLERRARDPGVVGAYLSLEGAQALEGDLEEVDRLFAAGFRAIGLAHFLDNEVGGSAHGANKGGLTPLGSRVVARMEQLGMAVDLAHASPDLIDDVLAIAERPVIVSHTGVKGTCDSPRNLDDVRISRIAATGGVIGIGLWPAAICGQRPDDWVRAVRHATRIAGVDHVALGSDWDGAVAAPVDAEGTVHLTGALVREGFSDDEIERIMGTNALRVLRALLPERAVPAP